MSRPHGFMFISPNAARVSIAIRCGPRADPVAGHDQAPRHENRVLPRRPAALSAAIFGPVDVIAEAHQMPARKVPPPWDGLPVTPARLRWRVRRGERTVRPWHTPIDLSKKLLPPEDFRRIYAPGTRQNRQGKPGLYRFYLAHTWSTTLLQTATTASRSKPPTSAATKAGCSCPSRSPTSSDLTAVCRSAPVGGWITVTAPAARTRGPGTSAFHELMMRRHANARPAAGVGQFGDRSTHRTVRRSRHSSWDEGLKRGRVDRTTRDTSPHEQR